MDQSNQLMSTNPIKYQWTNPTKKRNVKTHFAVGLRKTGLDVMSTLSSEIILSKLFHILGGPNGISSPITVPKTR